MSDHQPFIRRVDEQQTNIDLDGDDTPSTSLSNTYTQKPALASPLRRVYQASSCNTNSPRLTIAVTIAALALVACNIVVIGFCIKTLSEAGGRGEGCKQAEVAEVVAPLCVPCQEGMVKEGKGEEEGWRRYQDVNGDRRRDMCCPLDHSKLASAVEEIYHTVLEEKLQDFTKNPPEPYSFSSFFGDPQNTDDTVRIANHYKPSAHMTGVNKFDANRCQQADDNTSSSPTPPSTTNTATQFLPSMQTVCDWPLRHEAYRSVTSGYVRRLSWGLVVPFKGLYRVHTTVNFYFPFSQSTVDNAKRPDIIPVIHRIARYHAATGKTTILTDLNQTLSSRHHDGLTSFLVTLAELDIGDVISISVSHRLAMAIHDRWHSEGLFLVH